MIRELLVQPELPVQLAIRELLVTREPLVQPELLAIREPQVQLE